MKILFIGPNQRQRYNPGHQLFRDEIVRQHEGSVFYGPKHPDYRGDVGVQELVEQYSPDCIMTYNCKYTLPHTEGLEHVSGNILKVHFVEDYFGGYLPSYRLMLRRQDYDLLFCRSRRVQRILKEEGWRAKVVYCPYSVDDNVFKYDSRIVRHRDVVCAMSRVDKVYPLRPFVTNALREMNLKDPILKRVFDAKYVSILNQTRIGVNVLSKFLVPNWKMFEIPAMGAALFTDPPENSDELGFIDNYNCVFFETVDEFKKKVPAWLSIPENLERLAKQGYELIHHKHTNRVRVSECVMPAIKEMT